MSAGHNILILDDHVEVAQGLAEILDLSGYQVTMVHDGKSAVETYAAGSFDIGLFDVRMPGMNGVEAFMEVKRQRPDANIILMSGYADNELIEKALANGAAGLLAKPFEPEDLLAKIKVVAASGCPRTAAA